MRKRRKKGELSDTPAQIERCLECTLVECVNCLGTNNTKIRDVNQLALNMPEVDLIDAIYDTMEFLNLDRMPRIKELDAVMKDRKYSHAVIKRGGVGYWSERLGLKLYGSKKRESNIDTADEEANRVYSTDCVNML